MEFRPGYRVSWERLLRDVPALVAAKAQLEWRELGGQQRLLRGRVTGVEVQPDCSELFTLDWVAERTSDGWVYVPGLREVIVPRSEEEPQATGRFVVGLPGSLTSFTLYVEGCGLLVSADEVRNLPSHRLVVTGPYGHLLSLLAFLSTVGLEVQLVDRETGRPVRERFG